MSATGTTGSTRASDVGRDAEGSAGRGLGHTRRLTTETKASFKTTELIA